ncbi:MAG: ABC transporter substrate-binding protein [Polyangiaceae bacterium]|nr:ABC transporter substrate-binding protein [Polyangiaceae bacterium]MCW5792556.1 ABC transporter substrate-binding protein [Polyangiaceae bacterium]
MTPSVAVLALLALSLAACGGERADAGDARPLEIVVPTELGSLDPRFTTRALDVKVTRLIHAGLVGLDPETQAPVPLMAASLTWLGPTQLRVELNRRARFHSGAPLTPRDVCATLEALADPSLGSPHRVVVAAIGRCQETGEASLELSLREPRATLLTDLEVPILRADQTRSSELPRGELDGLGPFRVARFDYTEVSLERAPSAANHAPREVVVRTVRDENARVLRLLAGRADIAPSSVSPTLLPALTRGTTGGQALTVHARRGANVTYLLFQNDLPPTSQVTLRHAVAHAIDRQLIVDTLLAGKAQVASGLFPRGHWSADPTATPVPYDPAKAREALAGQELTLTTSTDRARLTIARAIAQMLTDAGARVRLIALDLGVLLKRLDAGDFQLAVLQMPELTEPNLLAWFFHPRGVPGEGGAGRNRARYRSPRVGSLLDHASATTDVEARRAAYWEVAHEMAKDLPTLPLWHEDQVAVLSPRAASFQLTAIGRWDALAQPPRLSSPHPAAR